MADEYEAPTMLVDVQAKVEYLRRSWQARPVEQVDRELGRIVDDLARLRHWYEEAELTRLYTEQRLVTSGGVEHEGSPEDAMHALQEKIDEVRMAPTTGEPREDGER